MKTQIEELEAIAQDVEKRFAYTSSRDKKVVIADGEPIIDDSACDDLNEDYETAEAFFMRYLLEYEVPENKKELRCGVWFLKDNKEEE